MCKREEIKGVTERARETERAKRWRGGGQFDRHTVKAAGLSSFPPGVCISGPGSQPCLPTLLHQ